MSESRAPYVPPAWFERLAWRAHRALYKVSRGRFLWTPEGSRRGWGALHLTTTGRRSGQPRGVILAYNDDGPRHALLAMNGWQEGHPEWFLNLQANPDAVATLAHAAPTPVRARVAEGPERDRLWALLRDAEPHLDDYAQRRRTETPIVVLEPREPSALR